MTKLSVDDILALDDTELSQHLQENRLPNGIFCLEFEEWESLAEDQRDNLIRRLRVGAERAYDAALSRPVDVHQVAAGVFRTDGRSTEAGFPEPHNNESSRHPPGPDENKKYEIVCYEDLLKDGCRPPYPISLLDRVSKNPGEYRELLQPWQHLRDGRTIGWNVYFKQLKRWQDFRRFQRDIRGMYDADKENRAHVEMRKWQMVRMGETEQLEIIRQDPEYFDYEFDEINATRRDDRSDVGEISAGSPVVFSEYAGRVERRLAKHGFTREFQLREDPAQQDSSATWTEYLHYEYAHYDRYHALLLLLSSPESEAQEQQLRARLRDSGALPPGATEDYLGTAAFALRHDAERAAASEPPPPPSLNPLLALLPRQRRTRRLAAAQARLAAARRTLGALRERDALAAACLAEAETRARDRALERQQRLLVGWVLRQAGPATSGEAAGRDGAVAVDVRGRTARRRGADRGGDGGGVETAARGKRAPRRAYKKTRASRRLAGLPPEFGVGMGRRETLRRRGPR